MAKNDTLHYPIDDLHTTATKRHKTVNDAWANHQTHPNQQTQTPALTLFKDTANALRSHTTSWFSRLSATGIRREALLIQSQINLW